MNIVVRADQQCPKCHKLDIEDPETLKEIKLCGRMHELEMLKCDCTPPFSIRWRDMAKNDKVGRTPNGTLFNTKTGELI